MLSKAARAKIKKIKEEESFRQGDLYQHDMGVYIMSRVWMNRLSLISIRDGNRFSDDPKDPFGGVRPAFKLISGSLKVVKSK